ncbi:unnamed protein product, partial [Ixodes hexagonus]
FPLQIGPPEFTLAREFRARQASNDSVVLASYENSINAIARTFRSGIPLQGIAQEIILLQHYLRQVPLFSSFQVKWYQLLLQIERKASEFNRLNVSERGSMTVTIWDHRYLHCINRFFEDEFNVRAVVNYLGWIIVELLGFVSYQRQLEAHRMRVYGYSNLSDVVETCGELAVKLAPSYCATLVFNAKENRAVI